MRKSYTYGIPFGLHRETGRFLDITEVSRGSACNCICPGCRTDLIARQGEVKLWHFSHSTDLIGDCDGLTEAIRGKIIDIIREKKLLGFPHLLAGYDGGTVPLDSVSGSGNMFGSTADLFVKVNDLCVAVFLDSDRSVAAKLTFEHLHASEMVAALRIDLPDIEYEISQVQLGRRDGTSSQHIEKIIINETGSREWLYHPMMQDLGAEHLKQYQGREPAEAGPLLQRLSDCYMKMPDNLPQSMNALIKMQQATIVCLCRLTVRASAIAQTDEFQLFTHYFRLHCLDTSEHVNYEKLLNWQNMIIKSQEGQSLTGEERDYLQEIARIGLYNHRLKGVCLTSCEDSNVTETELAQNYSLL